MKNSSNYKKSTGDEAATKSLGMGVVSHNIQGKMKHAAWSFDVKIEGANAIRHMDLTTHNHINADNELMTINQGLEGDALRRTGFLVINWKKGWKRCKHKKWTQIIKRYALANAQFCRGEGRGIT